MGSKQGEVLKLGDCVVYPINNMRSRKRYSSQIEAEIRIRDQMDKLSEFEKGGLVLQVISVVTKDKVESV